MALPDRFDRFVIPEPNSGCLLWLGGITNAGYPKICIDGEMIDGHRLSFARANPRLKIKGFHIRHSCDVKICVNDAHLFRGSPQDNSDDAVARDRIPFGERHWKTKLTERDVREVYDLSHNSPMSQRQIGRDYGLTQSQVSLIKSQKNWRRATS